MSYLLPRHWCLLLLLPLATRAAAGPAKRTAVPTNKITGPTNNIAGPSDTTIQIVFTSDIHYGITRPAFDGDSNVASYLVNRRMIATINTLPALPLPPGQGVNAGQPVGPIDYI